MNNQLIIILLVTVLSIFYQNVHAQQDHERHPAFNDVKNAIIVVRQSYGEADKIMLPYKETMRKLLHYAGITEDLGGSCLRIWNNVIKTANSLNRSTEN